MNKFCQYLTRKSGNFFESDTWKCPAKSMVVSACKKDDDAGTHDFYFLGQYGERCGYNFLDLRVRLALILINFDEISP